MARASNPFLRKLEHGARLTDDDRQLLLDVSENAHPVSARLDLIGEGDNPALVRVVLDGFACRYKILKDGRRQIMAFFVPGDMCDLHVEVLGWMDHSIATLTDCKIVELNSRTIEMLMSNPRINRALWWSTLTAESTLRERVVSIGQRPADQQIAHLICELLVRLQAVGVAECDSFTLPFTQEDLADATGITPVHVNRMVRHLRELGLVVSNGRQLTTGNIRKLMAFSDFDPGYLHFRDDLP